MATICNKKREWISNYQMKVDRLVSIIMILLDKERIGAQELANMMRGDELVHALAKVKRFIPADRAKDIELRVNQICIDLSPWIGSSNIQPYLEIIKTALQESKLVSFEYVAHHGNKTARTAEPYQLVLKNSYWYLQGYCHKRNDYRIAYTDYPACQTCKCRRKPLHHGIIKNQY